MRYLVAAWAILALLILVIHLVSEAGDDTILAPSGYVYGAMPGPPIGVVVDATPIPTPEPMAVAEGDSAPASAGEPGGTLESPSAPIAVQGLTPGTEISREALANLVHATFPDDPHMGNSVVWSESLFDPEKWRGYVYRGTMSITGDCGLMQINWGSHWKKFTARGWTQADCFIPERNLVIAREIYDTSGPWAWATY